MYNKIGLILEPIKILIWFIHHLIWKAKKLEIEHFFQNPTPTCIRNEILTLAQIYKEDFQKLPRHLAVVIHDFREQYLSKVASIVVWAWTMDIHFISLYDEQGIIKANAAQMNQLVSRALQDAKTEIWRSKGEDKPLPSLEFWKFNFESKFNKSDRPRPTLKVVLLGQDDCKQGIVTVTKELLKRGLNSNLITFSNKAVDFVTWETAINHNVGIEWCDAEPELMLVFGNVNSTIGFLPWHIRLTEIHWLPSIAVSTCGDFVKSLMRFSGCERRAGA